MQLFVHVNLMLQSQSDFCKQEIPCLQNKNAALVFILCQNIPKRLWRPVLGIPLPFGLPHTYFYNIYYVINFLGLKPLLILTEQRLPNQYIICQIGFNKYLKKQLKMFKSSVNSNILALK